MAGTALPERSPPPAEQPGWKPSLERKASPATALAMILDVGTSRTLHSEATQEPDKTGNGTIETVNLVVVAFGTDLEVLHRLIDE